MHANKYTSNPIFKILFCFIWTISACIRTLSVSRWYLYVSVCIDCMSIMMYLHSIRIQDFSREQVVSVCTCLCWLYLNVSAQYHSVSYVSVFIACICLYRYLMYVGPCQMSKRRVFICMYFYASACMYIACIECICMYLYVSHVSVRICMFWFAKCSIFGANTQRYSIPFIDVYKIHANTHRFSDTRYRLSVSVCIWKWIHADIGRYWNAFPQT